MSHKISCKRLKLKLTKIKKKYLQDYCIGSLFFVKTLPRDTIQAYTVSGMSNTGINSKVASVYH